MEFNYSRNKISKKEKIIERTLEILPGVISWLIIAAIIIISMFNSLFASLFIITFILYWLLRLIYMNIFLILAYIRLELEKDTEWTELISIVDNLKEEKPIIFRQNRFEGFFKKIIKLSYKKQLLALNISKNPAPSSKDIYHLVIIPVIKESFEVINPGIDAIKNGSYPTERILIVIALEEIASVDIKNDVLVLKNLYSHVFFDFLIVTHPADQDGEAKVKGANSTFAAKHAKNYCEEHKIPINNILVSCFDADSIPNKNYFSCLTYNFIINHDRFHSSYQPVPVYHNNIWQVPGYARIIDIGTSFFMLVESTNPKKLVTFSSHSMPFKSLIDVGYWPVDMISDDSAIFWKCFIFYDGNYQVVPIYTTISMDIAIGPDFKKTFSSIYKQKRRWAWGVENIPIVIRAFSKSKKITIMKKISYGYKLFDSFISWATWSFLLLFGTWLPIFFSSREFKSSIVYYTTPRIRSIIFSLASIGIIVCMIISLLFLPKKKIKYDLLIRIKHAFEWLLIPFVFIFLSAIPALDAQTRLMFGKYLDFYVTEKSRKKSPKNKK